MDHYRCYIVYITKTRSLRFTDTLAWLPSKVVMSVSTSTDIDIVAANDLTISLLNPSSAVPVAHMDDTTQYYLKTLSRHFGNHIIKGTYNCPLKPTSRVQFPPIPHL